jgi:hypothetical protein
MEHIFTDNIKQALLITSFVMVMMLIIEFINVYTRGRLNKGFQKKPFLQIIMATLLGAIPGCLGTFAVVSFFTHNVIGFGALMAALIASTGDEAFLMFSMFPAKALMITSILIGIALITGFLVHLLTRKSAKHLSAPIGFPLHDTEKQECFSVKPESIYFNLRFITFKRAILLVTLAIFIVGLALGEFSNFHVHSEFPADHAHHDHGHSESPDDHAHHDHGHDAHHDTVWVSITFMILTVIAFLISLFATNHFLDHHLWGHIVKVHFLRIFLWVFATLIVISLLTQFIDIDNWIRANKYVILLFALFIGVIPASGPHIIFITLFFHGTIPMSILLANSIVQDGHGALPLFAESKKYFFRAKAIKLLIAAIFATVLFIFGF